MTPHRQELVYALLLVTNHRHSHIACVVGLHKHQEWMLGTIGIPQREDSVVLEAVGRVDVLIQTTILAIDIHID